MTWAKYVIGGLGAVVALGACSSGGGSAKSAVGARQALSSQEANGSPAQAVGSALSKLGAGSSLELTFSLPVTTSEARQLKLGALASASVFLSEGTGHGEAVDSTPAQTDPLDSFDLGLSFGAAAPVEIRYVGQNLYARAQLGQLYRDLGKDPAQASRLTAELTQLNAAVPGLSSLAQGEWVEVSHAGLESLGAALHQALGAGAATSLSGSGLQVDLSRLRTEFLAALQANSTVASLGTVGGRNEYGMTVHVAGFLTTIAPAVRATLGSIPMVGSRISSGLSTAGREVAPGQTAVVDLYTTSGALSEADLDLNQFHHRYSFAVPLRIAVSSPGAPSAPSGATMLDVSKLPGLLGGLLGGFGSTSLG